MAVRFMYILSLKGLVRKDVDCLLTIFLLLACLHFLLCFFLQKMVLQYRKFFLKKQSRKQYQMYLLMENMLEAVMPLSRPIKMANWLNYYLACSMTMI